MRRKGFRDSFQQETIAKHTRVVFWAIRQIETESPFIPVPLKAIFAKLRGRGSSCHPSKKTVHQHLKRLIAKGKIVRVGRGIYLSTVSKLYQEIAKRFIQYDQYQKYQTHAVIDGIERRDFLQTRYPKSRTTRDQSLLRRVKRTLRPAIHDTVNRDRRMFIRDWVEDDLDGISDSTTLHVLAKRVPRSFNTTKLQNAIVKLLYHVVTNYRDDMALLDAKFNPADCGMTLIVTFDPHLDTFKSLVDHLGENGAKKWIEKHRRFMNDAYNGDGWREHYQHPTWPETNDSTPKIIPSDEKELMEKISRYLL